MNIDIDIVAKLLAPCVSVIIAWFFKRYLEARPKLISFIGHISAFPITDDNDKQTTVHTHSVVVRNIGRKPAHNVRLSHTFLPPHVTVFPVIKYSIEKNPEGAGEIVVPVLVPKEQITISYLYFPPVVWNQINQNTKSDEGFAKIIDVIPMPQPSKTILAVVWILMVAGMSIIIYLLFKLAMALM